MSRVPTRRRFANHVSSMAEALRRIKAEYDDIERVRAAGITHFDGVVYMAPLAKSEGRRLGDAIKALAARHRVPPGHHVELMAPRGSAVLYAQIGASSAESASQILVSLLRRALDEAGLTIEKLHLEVERADAMERYEGEGR